MWSHPDVVGSEPLPQTPQPLSAHHLDKHVLRGRPDRKQKIQSPSTLLVLHSKEGSNTLLVTDLNAELCCHIKKKFASAFEILFYTNTT